MSYRTRRIQRTRRPRRVPVAAALGLLALAVACSDPPTSGGNADQVVVDEGGEVQLPECPLDALEAADGPTEITLWYGGIGGPVKDTMEQMVAGFNASQDDIVLTASDQGQSYAEVFRKFESAASADQSQLPDVVYLENTQLQVLADSNLILPAQSCMEADGYDVTEIEPAVRSTYSVDDVLYPGYMNVSSQVLFYNKAHWARAGLDPEDPPGTLQEVYEAAKALKAAGIPKPLSFKVSASTLENWLSGEGVDVVDNGNGREGPATAATFNTPEAVEALELLQKMNEEGLLNPFANTEGGVDQFLALVTQDSSMLIETSTSSSAIAAALGGQLTPEDVGSDFDASVLDRTQLVPGSGQFPGLTASGQVHAGGGAFFIVNASEPAQQAASWKFLRYMLEPANAKAWHIQSTYLPIVKSVSDEPDVQAFWQDSLAGVLVRVAVEQLQDADPDEPGPLIGPYIDFADATEAAMEAVLFDDADVADALASAQEEVTASLERYGAE
jgi:sn-glycerol 3-phosphate transport system substrate-binding protein